MAKKVLDFEPQPGKQKKAFDMEVDVMFYGGSKGGGKSHLARIKALKYAYNDPNANGIVFRRNTGSVRSSMFEPAKKMFRPLVNPRDIKESSMEFFFKKTGGGKLKFWHLESVNDATKHEGEEYSFVVFDELTTFEESQFLTLLSRLRSQANYDSWFLGTCNPYPDSWVIDWIEWYLDDEGYPDKEKSGVIRYFLLVDNKPVFADDPQTLIDMYPDLCTSIDPDTGKEKILPPSTFTFLHSTIYDNPILQKMEPKYIQKLKAQPAHLQARNLYGCWYAREDGNNLFKREWLKPALEVPKGSLTVRAWDKGYGEPNSKNKYPDFTASIKMSKSPEGYYYISADFTNNKDESSDVYGRFRKSIGTRNQWILDQCEKDGQDITVIIPKEGGPGKGESELMYQDITEAGYRVEFANTSNVKDAKIKRFSPFSADCMNGFVYIVESSFPNRATLNAFLAELESFDGRKSSGLYHDDWVDCISDAFNHLKKGKVYSGMALPRRKTSTRLGDTRRSMR